MNLLVVDEDPNFARILGTVLSGEGHVVEVVATSAEAPAALARLQPRCLLLAVDPADAAGVRLLSSFRGLPGGAATTCVVMTAQADARVQRAAAASGTTHVLVRPFSVLDLAGLVRGLALEADPPPPPSAEPAEAIDVEHAARLLRLWARRANGIIQVVWPEGTEWTTLSGGGLVDPAGADVVRKSLYGGELEFHPCEVDGEGDHAALARLLWGQVSRAERARGPLPRGTVLAPTRMTEAGADLPVPPSCARLLRAVTAPIGYGRLLDELRLDAEEVEAALPALVALGVILTQEVPHLPTGPHAPVQTHLLVSDRPLAGHRNSVTPTIEGRASVPSRPPASGSTSSTATVSPASVSTSPRSSAPRSPSSVTQPRVGPRAPLPTPSIPPGASPRPLPPADPQAVLRRLRREVELLRSSDAWVVLGVPHDANRALVEAAGARMLARYQGLADANQGELRDLSLAMVRRVEAALAEIETPPEASLDAPGDDLFQAGLRAMARGDWALADRRFSAARDQNLDSARNLAHLGWARVHNPEVPAAERGKDGLDLLLLAEQFAPDYADGQYFLAMVLHRGGDDDAALRRLRRALKAEPGHVAANALVRKLRRGPPPAGR